MKIGTKELSVGFQKSDFNTAIIFTIGKWAISLQWHDTDLMQKILQAHGNSFDSMADHQHKKHHE